MGLEIMGLIVEEIFTFGEFGLEDLLLKAIKKLLVPLIVNLELKLYQFGKQLKLLQKKMKEAITLEH